MNNHAAGEAHQEDVVTYYGSGPQVDMEEGVARPNFLRVVQPFLPWGHLILQCKEIVPAGWNVRTEPVRGIHVRRERETARFQSCMAIWFGATRY
jgi:hypothetical protein